MNDTSLEQSDIDDISSMASGSMVSDFPKFRAGRHGKTKRLVSGISGYSGSSSAVGSNSSSEMAHISDNEEDVQEILRRHSVLRKNKVDMQTQTDENIQIVKICSVTEIGAQVDLLPSDTTSKSQLKKALSEKERNLEAERQ